MCPGECVRPERRPPRGPAPDWHLKTTFTGLMDRRCSAAPVAGERVLVLPLLFHNHKLLWIGIEDAFTAAQSVR